MQLDAEENEDVFYKPPVEPSARPSVDESQHAPTAATTGEDDD